MVFTYRFGEEERRGLALLCGLHMIRLNDVTTKDVYLLPRIDDALAKLEGATVFSIMDLQSGYWQVPVAA